MFLDLFNLIGQIPIAFRLQNHWELGCKPADCAINVDICSDGFTPMSFEIDPYTFVSCPIANGYAERRD
ncbi:hypothetical protein D3C74_451320 [compost metagenome]